MRMEAGQTSHSPRTVRTAPMKIVRYTSMEKSRFAFSRFPPPAFWTPAPRLPNQLSSPTAPIAIRNGTIRLIAANGVFSDIVRDEQAVHDAVNGDENHHNNGWENETEQAAVGEMIGESYSHAVTIHTISEKKITPDATCTDRRTVHILVWGGVAAIEFAGVSGGVSPSATPFTIDAILTGNAIANFGKLPKCRYRLSGNVGQARRQGVPMRGAETSVPAPHDYLAAAAAFSTMIDW